MNAIVTNAGVDGPPKTDGLPIGQIWYELDRIFPLWNIYELGDRGWKLIERR